MRPDVCTVQIYVAGTALYTSFACNVAIYYLARIDVFQVYGPGSNFFSISLLLFKVILGVLH